MYEKYDPIEILLGVKTWSDIDKRISLLDQRDQEDECSDIDDGIPGDKQSEQINDKRNDSNKDGNDCCAKEVQSSTSEQPLQGTTIQDTKTPQTEPSNLPSEVETSSSSPRKERFVSKMRFYSKNEQQQIVDYIINTRSY